MNRQYSTGGLMEKLLKSDKGNRGDALLTYLRTVKKTPKLAKLQNSKPIPPPAISFFKSLPQNKNDSRYLSFSDFSGINKGTGYNPIAKITGEKAMKGKYQNNGSWHPLEGSTELEADSYYKTLLSKNTTQDCNTNPHKKYKHSDQNNTITLPIQPHLKFPNFEGDESPIQSRELVANDEEIITNEFITYRMKRIWEILKKSLDESKNDFSAKWIDQLSEKLDTSAIPIDKNKQPSYATLIKFLFPKSMPLILHSKSPTLSQNGTYSFSSLSMASALKASYSTNLTLSDVIAKGNTDILEGEYTEALRHFSKRIEKHPLDLPANIGTFVALFLRGDLEISYKLLNHIMQYYPKNGILLYNKAIFELVNQKYDLVISTTTKALLIINTENFNAAKAQFPSFISDFYKARAIAYFQLGYLALAAKDYVLWRKGSIAKTGLKTVGNEQLKSIKLKNGIRAKLNLGIQPSLISTTISLDDSFIPQNSEFKPKILEKTERLITPVIKGPNAPQLRYSTITQLLKNSRTKPPSPLKPSTAMPRPTITFSRREDLKTPNNLMEPKSLKKNNKEKINFRSTDKLDLNSLPMEIEIDSSTKVMGNSQVEKIVDSKESKSIKMSDRENLDQDEEPNNGLSDMLWLDDEYGRIGASDLTNTRQKEELEEHRKYESVMSALMELKEKIKNGQGGFDPKALKLDLKGKGKGEITMEPGDLDIIRDELQKVFLNVAYENL